MIQKKASELQVGDVFYRDGYRQPKPGDFAYTAQSLQRIVLRGYYGEPLDMVQITAYSPILGSATFSLGVNESVWVADEAAPAAGSPDVPQSTAPPAWSGTLRSIRRRRRANRDQLSD